MRKQYVELGRAVDGKHSLQVPLEDLRYGCLWIGPSGRGKTRHAMSVCDQVHQHAPQVGQLIIDGKGDLHALARRRWYQRGLGRHLVNVDPNQDDFVTGLNFTSPWPGDEERQAGRLADLFIRMAECDPTVVVRMRKWMESAFTWILASRNFWSDGLLLLESLDNSPRLAVLPDVPESPARRDLEWLTNQAASGSPTAARLIQEQVGSSAARFRMLWGNPRLRRMFGTARAVDLGAALAAGQKVIVNLAALKLNMSEQRVAMLAVLNETLRVMQSMGESGGKLRVLVTIDDPRQAHGEELEALVTQGRSFGFGVQLCIQTCDMLRDPTTGDSRVLEAVLSCCRTKGAFGGLSYNDSLTMAKALWFHHLEPDQRRIRFWSPRQLQEVTTATSLTSGTSVARTSSSARTDSHAETESVGYAHTVAHGETEAISRARSSAHGVSRGAASLAGAGAAAGSVHGSGVTDGITMAGLGGPDTTLSHGVTVHNAASSVTSDFRADAHSDSATELDAETEAASEAWSRIEAETVSKGRAVTGGVAVTRGEALTEGRNESVTTGPMVTPGPVFLEPQVEFESLEIQLARHQMAMTRQPNRFVTVASETDRPRTFRTIEFPDPLIRTLQADELDRRRVGVEPHLTGAAEVDREIASRHRNLLGGCVDTPVRSGPDMLEDPAGAWASARAQRVRPAKRIHSKEARQP